MSLWLGAALVKLLLIPSYRSTDFEVHRNWLAITHSLKNQDWYYEDRSEWTLDYPPFFAWFEWIMSQFAYFVDKDMLVVSNLEHASSATIVFQRTTVVVTELLLYYAILEYLPSQMEKSKRITMLGLIFLNPGLLFVDNMHFQYNGVLYGILVLSIACMSKGRPLMGAMLFAAVLNFKHIYLYQAPAIFFYLLGSYCFERSNSKGGAASFSLLRFLMVGCATLSVFAVSFGPFALHLPQILSRLFPFKRGLCHAYWAPNFWALYSFADRILIQAYKIIRLPINLEAAASSTRGLVGTASFVVLPDVLPLHTLFLTVVTQLPIWYYIWRRPTVNSYIKGLVLCGFCSFLFGWHVHEKAILIVVIPLSLLSLDSLRYAQLFYFISITGYVSLCPLLFAPTDFVTKSAVLSLFAILGHTFLAGHFTKDGKPTLKFHLLEKLYLIGLIPVFLYFEVGHYLLFKDKMEFLPLMVVSVYTAVGITYGWIALNTLIFLGDQTPAHLKKVKKASSKSQ